MLYKQGLNHTSKLTPSNNNTLVKKGDYITINEIHFTWSSNGQNYSWKTCSGSYIDEFNLIDGIAAMTDIIIAQRKQNRKGVLNVSFHNFIHFFNCS